MTKLIEYVEVQLNEQLGPIAFIHGMATDKGISSTHHWLSDNSVWGLLASEYFGLPFPNIAVALRIAKTVRDTAPLGAILMLSTDHGMVVQAIQTPRPCAGIVQPPALLYQHCSKIFQAILEAKDQE